MQTIEHTLRNQSLAVLCDIQGWLIEQEIHSLTRECKTIQMREENISALEQIYQAMLDSAERFERIAASHRLVFVAQMRAIGATNATTSEPYLNDILAQHRLEYLQALESLFNAVNALFDQKSIDPTALILDEVSRELATMEARAEDRLTSALDEARQRSNGVACYRWLTAGDERVRESHAAREGQIFDWNDSDIVPGEEFGCRCSAVPVANENGEYQVAAIPIVIGYEAYVLGGAIIAAAGAEVARRQREHNVLLNEGQGDGSSDTKPDSSNTPSNGDKDPDNKNKEIADTIGAGHAYDKHKDKFPDVTSKEDLKRRVEDIMNNPDEVKDLERGRTGYWDNKTGTVVIDSPNDPDGGTVFRPDEGREYFDKLK